MAWLVNVALLIGAFAWIFGSGQSLRTIELLHGKYELGGVGTDVTIRDPSRLSWDTTVVSVGAGVAAVTQLVMFGSLFLGPRRFRTTRLWLVFTAVTCGWLGLLVSWQDIYWWGQRYRVKSDLAPIAELARKLNADWPVEDGEYPGLGMYLAYPKGAPRTMLLLGDATFPQSTLRVSSIERTADGAIRFELSGKERGAWLEWRADDSAPESFVGGLESDYRVARYERIAPEWFLVRYRTPGRLGSHGDG